MKIKAIVGILALLCSTVGFAATVTVTPSTANPAPTDSLSVTISGDALFPLTTGATLGVTYDAAVISIGTAVPIGPNFNFAVFTPTGVGTGLVSVISTSAAGIAGPFDAFTLNLTALAAGDANLVFVDDGIDLGWSDPTAQLIEPVTYNQASITVAGAGTPDIAVDDLDVQFGDVTQGQTGTQTVTVTNNGGAALDVGQVAGLIAPFSLGTDTCSNQSIAAAASCTIQVQFQPVAGGPFSGSLNIPSNDADTPTATVALSGNGVGAAVPNITVDNLDVTFGDITVDQTSAQTVTVTNSGSAALDLGQVAGLVAPFSLGTDNCSNQSIAAAGSCTIAVNFDPVAVGPFTGALNIPSNDPDTATVTVDVAGNGVASATPNIVVTDSVVPNDNLIIPFGSITQGGTSLQTVTVTNSGSATLNVGQVAGLTAPFSLGTDNCSNQAIAAAGSCTIQVNFDPVAVGLFSSSLNIPSDDPDTATVTVSVSGTGTLTSGPAISVSDSVSPSDDLQVGFGNVFINSGMEQTVTVTNVGASDLVISAVGVAVPLAAPFSIITDSNRCSFQTLSPAESCTILIVYAPTALGVSNGSFDIPSNDPDDPSVTVHVSGNSVVIDSGNSNGSSAVDPLTLAGLALVGIGARRRRRQAAA